MYNQELKQRYIENGMARNKQLDYTMDYYFRKSAQMESELNKDLSQFTTTEIIDLYKSYLFGSMETLMQINSQYSKYTTWCIGEGLVPDCQNHFSEITYDMILDCLNKGMMESRAITREELIGLINDTAITQNACDKVCYLGLFEGICGPEFQEIYNIRKSDVRYIDGNHIISLHSKAGYRELVISDELYAYISAAAAADELISPRPITGDSKYKTDYIVHKLVNNDDKVWKDREAIFYTTSTSRIRRIQNVIKVMKNRLGRKEFTAKSIMEFGRIHMIKELMEKDGIYDLDTCIRMNRNEIEYQYGRIPSVPRYIQKYGKYFETESQ